jgi:hypothetical protein
MARPTKLNKELILKFATLVSAGVPIAGACRHVHIGEETYYRWRREVEDGRGTTLQKKLIKEVDCAASRFMCAAECTIVAAGRKSWRALAWMLEARCPEVYGRKRAPAPEVPAVVDVEFSLL